MTKAHDISFQYYYIFHYRITLAPPDLTPIPAIETHYEQRTALHSNNQYIWKQENSQNVLILGLGQTLGFMQPLFFYRKTWTTKKYFFETEIQELHYSRLPHINQI